MAKKLNEKKYCGWCGDDLSWGSGWMSVCDGCGFKDYVNPSPCSNIAVLNTKREVLFLKRAIKPNLGKFDLPGGFMDMDDGSIEQAAYRELREEVNLSPDDITELEYFGSGTEPYEWLETIKTNVCFFFYCSLKPGVNVSLDKKENSNIRWVKLTELDTIDYAWDVDKSLLTKLRKILNE